MSAYKDKTQGTWYVSFRYIDWTGKKIQKLKRGFISLTKGNWRNSSEYGNIEIAVKSIRCFHKYTFRLTEKAYLSMLRNAA